MKRLILSFFLLSTISLFAQPFKIKKYSIAYPDGNMVSSATCAELFISEGKYLTCKQKDGNYYTISKLSVMLIKTDEKEMEVQLINGDIYKYSIDKYDFSFNSERNFSITEK